jgi:hypothetical protein
MRRGFRAVEISVRVAIDGEPGRTIERGAALFGLERATLSEPLNTCTSASESIFSWPGNSTRT